MADASYFLILSLRRCGSTFLSFLLNEQNDVFCDYEFVKRDAEYLKENHVPIVGDDFSFLSRIRDLAGAQLCCGSKVTIPEYQVNELGQIIGSISREPIKIVHLVRKLSHQYISLKAAKQSNVWHVVDRTNDKADETHWSKDADGYICKNKERQRSNAHKFVFEADEINEFCQHVTTIDEALADLSKTQPYLQVRYDEIERRFVNILQFVGGPQKSVEIKNVGKTEKVINVPHEQLVENWDDVAPIFEDWERKRDKKLGLY